MLASLSMLTKKLGTKKQTKPHRCSHHKRGEYCPTGPQVITLADITPGKQVRVTGFCPAISPDRKAHLLAYGLVPGYWVRVLQHSPVTVIQVEYTELAMELELACEIQVEAGLPPTSSLSIPCQAAEQPAPGEACHQQA